MEKQSLTYYWVLIDTELWTHGGLMTLQADISILVWISPDSLINKVWKAHQSSLCQMDWAYLRTRPGCPGTTILALH